jgi:hypothetical protein
MKERQEAGEHRPPEFSIQSECALTNMNAVSGENLTSRVLIDEVDTGVSQDTGGALRSVTDRARFCWTTETCIWGVSDPKTARGTMIGGWQRGSPHAPDTSFAATVSRADCDTRGTERRPVHRGEVAQNEGHRQNGSDRQRRPFCRAFDRESPAMEGERCSRVCVPPSFSSLSRF